MTTTSTPRIGIIGGGIQGCTIAMALARRGIACDVIEQSPLLMDRASRWNEGKLHLGFVYGRDQSMETARAMIAGSCAFHPFFKSIFGPSIDSVIHSSPFDYVVHKDSMVSAGDMFDYLVRCEQIFTNHSEALGYWPAQSAPRVKEIDHTVHYNPARVDGVFQTPELSINPHRLADLISDYVLECPLITTQLGDQLDHIEHTNDGAYDLTFAQSNVVRRYDIVVNASWESRLKFDHQLGITPPYKWLHRYKMACQIRGANLIDAPSSTIVLGAFGDLVNFGNGSYYISWYPDGKIDESSEITPHEAESTLTDRDRQILMKRMVANLGDVISSMADLDLSNAQTQVRGGHIFAWGDKDVDHYDTQLHERSSTGVESHGNYHTINTGKYCSAILNTHDAVSRIVSTIQPATAGGV